MYRIGVSVYAPHLARSLHSLLYTDASFFFLYIKDLAESVLETGQSESAGECVGAVHRFTLYTDSRREKLQRFQGGKMAKRK